MKIDFGGRAVVVTGATGELGAAVARALVAAGAVCHLPARSAELATAAFSDLGDAVTIVGGVDLGDESAVASFYAALPPIWGSIHAAGGFAMAPAVETSLADFERLMRMNAASTFLCSREAARRIERGGRIVNVAAAPALDPRRGAGMVAYTASKAAVAALTVALAEELAPRSIWVNAVVPSLMDTPINRKAIPSADFAAWPKVDEVAATIAFLASPQNAVTRGALVPVYGRT